MKKTCRVLKLLCVLLALLTLASTTAFAETILLNQSDNYDGRDRITLAQAAVMLNGIVQYGDKLDRYFSDIDSSSEAGDAILRLANAGIVYVPADGDLCYPSSTISRQDAASMIYKLLGFGRCGTAQPWNDYGYVVKTDAVNALYYLGCIPEIMLAGNCFAPNMAITISQFSEMLTRAVAVKQEFAKSTEDVGQFTKQIGTCTTNYIAGESGRNTNIKLASEGYISGTVLAPGDEFSFNKIVGNRTYARGFRDATIFVGSGRAQGVGGGICQASTTTFVAALNAGMTVLERHQHSMTVNYIDLGLDATVSYGQLDMRFRNDLNVPVKITCSADSDTGTIVVNFWTVSDYEKPKTYVGTSYKNGKYYGYRYINGVLDWYTESRY